MSDSAEYDREFKHAEEIEYNLKCLACGELIEVSVDPANLPSGPIPCEECGDESWKWSDAESFVDERDGDVPVAELIDDADMEKLEPGSGGPLGNSSVRRALAVVAVLGTGIGTGVLVSTLTPHPLVIAACSIGAFHVADLVAREAYGHEYHEVSVLKLVGAIR